MKSSVIKKTNSTPGDRQPEVISAVQKALLESSRILVVSHVDPDGDALGTQLAFVRYLKDMGKTVWAYEQSSIPGKYQFLFESAANDANAESLDLDGIDTLLALECPQLERLGDAARYLGNGTKVINIDHHPDNKLDADVSWLDQERSSVGEMAYEYFDHVGYPISPTVAEQLYTAILTDTGQFRFSSTSPRTMQIAGELIRCGANPTKIVDAVYCALTPGAMKLLGSVLNSIEYVDNDRVCILTMTREMLRSSGAEPADSEGLVDYTLRSRGSICGVLFKEIDKQTTKASLRSRDGINVSKIAAQFGGGGHFNAAGCTIDQGQGYCSAHKPKLFCPYP